MSLDKLNKLVSSLAKTVEDKSAIATPVLAIKLAKCLEEYPHDQTIGAMSRVIEKMAGNNTTFITKADFRDLYNKLYSRNSKFAELFQDELGMAVSEEITRKASIPEAELPSYEVSDSVLANALNTAFDNTIPLRTYSKSLADKAVKSVLSTLDAWSVRPNSISVSDGNEKVLVVQADYETPKGVTSIHIPVEVVQDKVLEASLFVGNAGPTDINNVNIKNYVKAFAGKKLSFSGSQIVGAINKFASAEKEITNVELLVAKMNSAKEVQSEFFQNQIVGQKVATAEVKDVELPKSNEFSSFEEKFASALGVASFNFGSDKVKIGRDVIVRELHGFGHKNPQITVTNSDKNTIYYGVSLSAGKVAFTVPVKIQNNKVVSPNVLLCNGSVSVFSKQSINSLYVNNETDYKVAAAASPQFGLKPSELIENIRQAMVENNHAKAEDALNVLANAGDEKAYLFGFNAYMKGLSNSEPVEESSCSMSIKSASSQHLICGHTGLPVHKVYQDSHGNCRPLYRKGMDETFEGATFINSKIFG